MWPALTGRVSPLGSRPPGRAGVAESVGGDDSQDRRVSHFGGVDFGGDGEKVRCGDVDVVLTELHLERTPPSVGDRSETRSLAEVKAHLSELVARVGSQHDRVTVTVHGRPAATLVAVDDLDALEETIAVRADEAALRALADAEVELARGDG
jgi:antitoxin YefM